METTKRKWEETKTKEDIQEEAAKKPAKACETTCPCHLPLQPGQSFDLEYQDRLDESFRAFCFGPTDETKKTMKIQEFDWGGPRQKETLCSYTFLSRSWIQGGADPVQGQWRLVCEAPTWEACQDQIQSFFTHHPEFKVPSLENQEHYHLLQSPDSSPPCVLAAPVCLDHLRGYAKTHPDAWKDCQPAMKRNDQGECMECQAAIAQFSL